MYQCTTCHREFFSDRALHAHCRDKKDHPYCESCEILFRNFVVLGSHMHDMHSDSDDDSDDDSESSEEEEDVPYCKICNQEFGNSAHLTQHLSSSRHNWCFLCSQDFSTANALSKHLSSQVHRPRNMKCPLCSDKFKMTSSIAQHIECGACHQSINRHTVTQAVHALDLIPTISINRRITGGSTPATRTITAYSATERAFNAKLNVYECYLCRKTFKSLNGLNSHLSSAAHDSKEFKCPKCQKQYTLISGLVQHIESEACGIAKFEGVREQMLGDNE
ncbi:hypothetical protein BT96DRAFT_814372 [Gymnopus androsaceus JB14]|uniref:C2H2-type domain-containing protein n=1 Tax=Gymnopus androsaceus JB14 TaxID=1447944 RepID=A0A6A4I1P0_9AGAR|nr:hypothetical protein BT96DRAFT_814372 [Gymnopus androsaceus JB14]